MQQYLPFTVLKQLELSGEYVDRLQVATVLTVYGIETVLLAQHQIPQWRVATVLTVYGIETGQIEKLPAKGFFELQQYLPFTVLKP